MPKVSDNHIMDTKALKTVLSVCPLIELPGEGDLHHLVTVEGVKVLVWNFTQFTRCSSASINDLILLKGVLTLKIHAQQDILVYHFLLLKVI